MYVIVNDVDFYPFTSPGMVTIKVNPVDDPNSGRQMAANMERSIVAIKEEITMKFPAISQDLAERIFATVAVPFVRVSYISPRLGARKDIMFYAQISSVTATLPRQLPRGRGISAWSGLELKMVEK